MRTPHFKGILDSEIWQAIEDNNKGRLIDLHEKAFNGDALAAASWRLDRSTITRLAELAKEALLSGQPVPAKDRLPAALLEIKPGVDI